jgi:hypothetical protein
MLSQTSEAAMSLIIFPTRVSKIRAFATANPGLTEFQLAHHLRKELTGVNAREIKLVLGRGEKRRVKSVAKP